jgi:RNA recognition motif-containing protein
LQGKKVTSKKAEAKQGKIYVGKLPQGEALSKEDIQNHFSEYGQVNHIFIFNVLSRKI